MRIRPYAKPNQIAPGTDGGSNGRTSTLVWILFLSSFLGYFLLSIWLPLSPNFERLMGVRAFTPSLIGGLGYGLLFSLLYAFYWQLYRLVQDGKWRPSLRRILLLSALIALPTLFTYPFNANDIYRYVIRGRISAIYQANPFVLAPNSFPSDPFLSLAGEWAVATSPYGPIWELVAWVTTSFTQDDLLAGLLTFKLIGIGAHLIITGLIWGAIKRAPTAERRGNSSLWALNPALLLFFGADGHNDVLMLLWLVGGWWLTKHKRPQLGFWLMLLAPLTKPIALLPLPFFFLAVWRSFPEVKAKIRFALLSALIATALSWLTFAPFGSPLALIGRLMQEASGGAGFSLVALLILLLNTVFEVRLTAALFSTLLVAGVIVMALSALWLVWQTWWRGRSPVRAAADIFALYIFQAFNFRLWYSAWPFPFLLLDANTESDAAQTFVRRFRLHAGLWFLFFVQLSVTVFGHGWAYLFQQDSLVTHLIGVPLTFVLPLLFGWLSARREHSG